MSYNRVRTVLGLACILPLLVMGKVGYGLSVSVVGVGDYAGLSYSPASTTANGLEISLKSSSKLGIGAGALLGVSVLPMVEFETGGLYITRKHSESLTVTALNATGVSVYTQKAIQVPMVLRLHIGKFLSVGAGGFLAVGTGDVQIERDNALSTGVATTTTDTYGAAGLKRTDYGVLISGALYLPLGAMTSFMVDGRYCMGLADVNLEPTSTDPAIKQKYSDAQILVGLRFSTK